jgi:putative hydrolase of the HAD superfamily
VVYKTIIFDLDSTLYGDESGVWQAVRARIESYMAERLSIPLAEIPVLRQEYLAKYGTTMQGLYRHYEIDRDDFMLYVHDIPIDTLIGTNSPLAEMLAQLPQSKWVLTNSTDAHSRRVLDALGVSDHFVGILDSKSLGYRSKPDTAIYPLALQHIGQDPTQALFIDDQIVNLEPAKRLGAGTVLVGSAPHPGADYQISRIEELLAAIPALLDQQVEYSDGAN